MIVLVRTKLIKETKPLENSAVIFPTAHGPRNKLYKMLIAGSNVF